MDYFSRKAELSLKANEHTIEMSNKYSDEIRECIDKSLIWTSDNSIESVTFSQGINGEAKRLDISAYKDSLYKAVATTTTEMTFCQSTTDEALMSSTSDKIVVLNFASYTNPGGMFLQGSSAQEESLCHKSYLFNVLRDLHKYYEWNNKNKNKGLYTNRAIYSYDVRFFDNNGSTKLADVITCAAPNRILLVRYGAFSENENEQHLESRIKFLKCVAFMSNPYTQEIILGAFGCGVFKQNAEIVGRMMKDTFSKSSYSKVTFAIPDNKNMNLFKKSFNNN